jgi:hypothetical protein
VMTREEAIAEAERGQASDPDASWIAASRGGEWTLVRIMERDTPRTHPIPWEAYQARLSRSSSLSSGIWGWPPPRWSWLS